VLLKRPGPNLPLKGKTKSSDQKEEEDASQKPSSRCNSQGKTKIGRRKEAIFTLPSRQGDLENRSPREKEAKKPFAIRREPKK